MSSKNYISNDIPEEIDSKEINPINGQKSPIIKPKLDDTLPSILNLSSEMSTSLRRPSKNDSFHIDDFKINNNLFKFKSFIPLYNNNSTFIKCHCKASSNEIFTNPNIFNFLNIKESEKNKKDEEDDNSSYYEGGLQFDDVINFWGDNNKEQNEENDENEKNKKKVIIDYEDGNENEQEDINEGFDILNMLQKGKKKNKK